MVDIVTEKAISLFDRIEQWDLLILLDGCRYDIFNAVNTLEGTLRKVRAVGSCTIEYVMRSILRRYDNLIYVSSNPIVSSGLLKEWGKGEPFFRLEEVWDYGWDDKIRTVHPATTTFAALELLRDYPQKKMVIHYIQPHHPFIGKFSIKENGWKQVRDRVKGLRCDFVEDNVYDLLSKGLIDSKPVLCAYADNLRLVFEYVQIVIRRANCRRIVITSDHGDCFGEHGIYGHPADALVEELLAIPWFCVDPGEIDRIKKLPIDADIERQIRCAIESKDNGKAISEKLRDLGYM